MKLFEPAQVGAIEVNNRMFIAPMTRSRSDNPDAAPTDIHVEYYKQRASSGLIITEGTVVSPKGVGYINVPGIYSEKQVAAWKPVTQGVHEAGGKIFMQIWHVGRMSHPTFHGGDLPVAPSAINPNQKVFTPNGMTETVAPKEMTVEEIKATVQDFKNAAVNAINAGFDGIEVHSSNGYLFHQFFTNCSNTRTDQYGGSDENKARFFFEVLDAIKEVMPLNKVGVRLNPMLNGMGITPDAETAKTFEYIITKLNDYNLAYLHLTRAGKPVDVPNFVQDVIGHYRKFYNGFLVANGGYDKESGETELSKNTADAIAYARPFISNPDLVDRYKNDWPIAEWDQSTFYTPGPKGYTDYPAYSD